MANENPAASADNTAKKAAAKKAAPKKAGEPKKATAPKKAAQPKPKPAAAPTAPPATSAAGEQATQVEPAPLQVGQKVRWYPNGSENLPADNYEATIVELPNSNGIASLVVSIEGEVKDRAAGTVQKEGTAYFAAE